MLLCGLHEKQSSSSKSDTDTDSRSRSKCILADLGGRGLLGSTRSLFLGLEGGQSATVRAIFLLTQVYRRVSLLFELVAGGCDALLGEDGQDFGNVLSDRSNLGQFDLLLADFGDAELSKLFAMGSELLDQLGLFVLSQLVCFDSVHFILCVLFKENFFFFINDKVYIY